MPWIKPVKQQDLKKQPIYDNLEQPVPIFNRLIANSPEILEGFLPLQNAIKETFLSDLEREAIVTYVSFKNGCEYCTKGHSSILEDITGDDEVLEKLKDYQQSDWEENLKAMLTYAEKLISKPATVSKSDIEALKEHGYSEKEITEINHVVAYTSFTNQISIGLGL